MNQSNAILPHIESFARKNFVPIIRPKSAQILCELVQVQAPKRVLEVGTAIGYSAILMLENAPDARLVTIEKDACRLEIARQNFEKAGLSPRVETILGDANQVVQNLDGTFDFIFLDGPKSHYGRQLPHLLNHLAVGGTIVADNVLFMGKVLSGEYPAHKHRTAILRLREFLQMVETNPNLESKLLDVEDGMLIIKKIK
ncbi:MAG: O-methyltransferase [Clostridia bacterium]|nr:O-methyltransferase [Clostridia bacterium]